MRDHRYTLKLAVLCAIAFAFAVRGVAARIGAPSETADASLALDTTRPVEEISAPPGGWSFRNHVIPVLTKLGCNSGACHGAAAGKNGFKLTLRGYDPELDYAAITRQSLGRRANAVDPARSLILLKPTMSIAHGGGKRMAVDSIEFKVLSEWVGAGMPAPEERDTRIVDVEVTPTETKLAPGAEQALHVKARYTDGRVEDVTRWVKYDTADSSIAAVDDQGRVRMLGSGESAISIWYQSRVAVARVFSPYVNSVSADTFTRSPRNNFVDELVIRKLEKLRIGPSEQASDAEFVRRAFLDATGTLPTPQEVEKFAADKATDKRGRLIDSLLDRNEYVDYWTMRWSDLLLVSRRRLGSNAMWSFYNFVRKSVAANEPWDRFARQIVTASGNTLENGAANFFVLHKEPTELTENLSLAFLGMSITCARCHNHPMEKWTQKQYFEMANLFGRVGLKNGIRAGDVEVYSKPTGDVNHPRLGRPLPPRPLDGKELPIDSQVDRREFLADWLTSPENPYFARAVVNRVWKNFMGRGLVEAVDDMRATNPPSNSDLMDALVRDFVGHKFDIKHLTRTIMNSSAYQRSSRPNEANRADDRYYSRYLIKRLPAEVMLDAISQVTGVPTEFPDYAAGIRAVQLPDGIIGSYFLRVFGKPARTLTLESERSSEPSVPQALHIINGDTLNQKLRAPGSIVDSFLKLGVSDEMIVEHLYLAALSRRPNESEIQQLRKELSTGGGSPDSTSERRQTIEDLVWAVLTSREFLFNH